MNFSSLTLPPKPAKGSVIAAFDFDKTLTTSDTFVPFLFFATSLPTFLWNMIRLAPSALLHLIGLRQRSEVKAQAIRFFFRGWSAEQFESLARLYATEKLPKYLSPNALQRLNWHREQGHVCVLVSASLRSYLKVWADATGVDAVISSEAERKGNHLTGELVSGNCWGPEKARRLELWLQNKEDYTVYAYGDSRGDHEMLAFADYAFYRRLPEAKDFA